MNYILPISSQSQVLIPAGARRLLGVSPGDKLILNIQTQGILPTGSISPLPKSWIKLTAGLGKGLWGKGEEYVKKDRLTWNQ